jgi:hypothetical protein
MRQRQLLAGTLALLGSGAVAAGTSTVTGNTIDTQGYEDVTIITHLGAVTATGTPTLKAAQGEAADGSDKADIEGSAVAGTDADSNKALAVEIHRPKNRYITPILLRPTANAAVVLIEVLLSNPSHTPVTQSYIVNSVALNTPDSGTA